jgi:hypothetical protein
VEGSETLTEGGRLHLVYALDGDSPWARGSKPVHARGLCRGGGGGGRRSKPVTLSWPGRYGTVDALSEVPLTTKPLAISIMHTRQGWVRQPAGRFGRLRVSAGPDVRMSGYPDVRMSSCLANAR